VDDNERGSVLPLCAVVLVVAATLVLAVGRLGEAAVARAHARTAADAAALAGAAAGQAAATETAAANGARLVAFEPAGRDVRVTVMWGPARATARARSEAGPPGEIPGTRGTGR
jgi:hypothetical protein